MNLKFTQFNLFNSEESKRDEEERRTIMEENESLFFPDEQETEFSPSDQTIEKILNFARSYRTVPSTSLEFIDMHMN